MKIKLNVKTGVESFVLNELERLDPVTMILIDGNGKGKIIVECFGESWSTYFGSIGKRELIDFISTVNSDYLSNRLISNTFHRPTKRETQYVERISQAIIDGCKLLRGKE